MPQFVAQHTPIGLEAFERGYLEAAEWLLDERETENREVKGWGEEALSKARKDCDAFQEQNVEMLEVYYQIYMPREGYDVGECAGHDFFLTRNGHGSGFWDRGKDPCFEALSQAAHAFGESNTCVGDNGFIYFE